MTENDLYGVIAKELSANAMDPALWTRAFAECEGNAEKAKALYIRLRLAALRNLELEPSAAAPPSSAGPSAEAGLQALRSRLGAKLQASGRASLYAALGLQPTCGDGEIADAIAALRSGAASGFGPELTYAIETLGDPGSRLLYDRNLLQQLSSAGRTGATSGGPEVVDAVADDGALSWWRSRKMSVLIGVVSIVAVGYLGLAYLKERNQREVQREALRIVGDHEQARAHVQETAVEKAAELGNRSQAFQEAQAERRRLEQERLLDTQRYEQERRREAQLKEQDRRLESQRDAQRRAQQQDEERKAARQRAYWSCLNAALDRMNTANAELRCAQYK